MPLTVNAKVYTADGFSSDAVHFQGPAHTINALDTLIQKRYMPKPTPDSSGKSRYLVKLDRTATLTGAIEPRGKNSAEVMFTVAVGTSDADRDALATDLGTYIASAAFKALLKSGQTNG